jgi:hypothetical protein
MGAANIAGRTLPLAAAVVLLLRYDVVGYSLFGFDLWKGLPDGRVSMLTTDGFTKPVALSDGAKIFHRELGAVRGDGIRGRTRGAGHRAGGRAACPRVEEALDATTDQQAARRRLLGTVRAPVAIPAARHCR